MTAQYTVRRSSSSVPLPLYLPGRQLTGLHSNQPVSPCLHVLLVEEVVVDFDLGVGFKVIRQQHDRNWNLVQIIYLKGSGVI